MERRIQREKRDSKSEVTAAVAAAAPVKEYERGKGYSNCKKMRCVYCVWVLCFVCMVW